MIDNLKFRLRQTEELSMTRSELENAIEFFLGEDVYKALADSGSFVGLPRVLEMASLKAFREEADDPRKVSVEYQEMLRRLRCGLQMLQSPGYFEFDGPPSMVC